MKITLPSNVMLMATHGVATNPESGIFDGVDCTYAFTNTFTNLVIQRNFTDFGTAAVLRQFEKVGTYAPPQYARAFVDPNRAMNSMMDSSDYHHNDESSAFRTVDFGGNQVFAVEPSDALRQHMVDTLYKPYLKGILKRINKMVDETKKGPILVIDIHDTGNNLMDAKGGLIERKMKLSSSKKVKGFVGAVVSDLNGESADPKLTKLFAQELEKAYKANDVPIDKQGGVHINEPFGGAEVLAVTAACRADLGDAGRAKDAKRVHVIQLELNRSRIVDEATQTVVQEGVELETKVISEAIEKTLSRYK